MDRRKFIVNMGVATGAAMFFPGCASNPVSPRKIGANEKINMAMVGVGGSIGYMAINGVKDENNIVALCDVDEREAVKARKEFPNARFFKDYREMLDKMGSQIDAVCVSTPDHSHFKITLDSMQCGKHVCVQKPLVHNVWQCRELERARKYYKVQTQMMNQGHATDAIRRIKEWYDTGACGDIKEVHVMCSGPNWGNEYFQKPKEGFPLNKDKIPAELDWNLWLNQAADRDFNNIFLPRTWRGFWEYGTGMLGDWFCHTADAPVWCLDLKDPVKVELVEADFDYSPDLFIPNSSTVKWTFPATDKHKEVVMYWYDGAKTPLRVPPRFNPSRKVSCSGMYMIGDKQSLETGCRPQVNPRFVDDEFFKEFRKNQPPKTLPRARKGSLYCEWCDAIRGVIPEAESNFSYASQLTEVALLGVLAQRFGGVIEWDAKNMTSPNRPELDKFIKEPERNGWESVSF